MPVTISDAEYSEYQIFLRNSIHQQKLDSVRGMKKLENDIDVPMKKLVALFSLLGCVPMWSCCGFDYDGQPIHKTHEYGAAYIAFKFSDKSSNVIQRLIDNGAVVEQMGNTCKWEVWITNGITYLRSDFDYEHEKTQYPWSIKSCIHYPEISLIMIEFLENSIIKWFLPEEFSNEVVLSDTNGKQKIQLPNWQYPSLEDWTIKKSDYFLGL
jgi:hypothetical protein